MFLYTNGLGDCAVGPLKVWLALLGRLKSRLETEKSNGDTRLLGERACLNQAVRPNFKASIGLAVLRYR